MNKGRERILKMVEKGTISKEEGEQLLAALQEGAKEEPDSRRERKPEEKSSASTEQKLPATSEAPPSRSVGVMIAGCLLVLSSFFWLFGGLWGLCFRNPLHLLKFQPAHLTLFNMVEGATLSNTLFTIFALLILIPAIGILFFKEWARKLVILVLAAHALFTVLGMTLARVSFIGVMPHRVAFWDPVSRSSIFLWLVLDIFLIWYFNRSTLRPQFS